MELAGWVMEWGIDILFFDGGFCVDIEGGLCGLIGDGGGETMKNLEKGEDFKGGDGGVTVSLKSCSEAHSCVLESASVMSNITDAETAWT